MSFNKDKGSRWLVSSGFWMDLGLGFGFWQEVDMICGIAHCCGVNTPTNVTSVTTEILDGSWKSFSVRIMVWRQR